MNYIFTDIDGVLTSSLTSLKNHDPDGYKLDPICVNKLLKLVDYTNSKVIISSNWIKYEDTGYINVHDKKYYSLMPELIDLLGSRYHGHISHTIGYNKGGDIRNYIVLNKLCEPKKLILDDHDSDLSLIGYNTKFVIVDSYLGLSDSNVNKALEFFND